MRLMDSMVSFAGTIYQTTKALQAGTARANGSYWTDTPGYLPLD